MNILEIPNQESTEEKLIEAIKQLDAVGFGEGAAVCQLCGSVLREGEPVVAYAFRPVSQPGFDVGYVLCPDHRDDSVGIRTLGVREVIVRGRIGRVVDQARQSSWRVVLEPEVVAVSPPGESGGVLGNGRCAGCVGGGA
jgi:hypothetical protein